MPRIRGPTSGYARIAQAEEDEADEGNIILDDSDDDATSQAYRQKPLSRRQQQQHQYASTAPTRRSYMQVPPGGKQDGGGPSKRRTRRRLRPRSDSGVDIKAINARLEKWAEEIAQKFKLRKFKGRPDLEEKLEIEHSVFQAPDDMRPTTADSLAARLATEPGDRLSKIEFDDIVESVRVAIEMDVHPRLILQGSSGSYFARNSEGKVVGVFKPKDEEPYANKNPKWTKWIHRNLFPFFFGRACLIPNLSYISEAAAYVLDSRLQTNLVPYTDVVRFSSISFNYDYWDRRAYYRKGKSLPAKVGSFQVFLKGYKDANIFLKQHPWPDQSSSDMTDGSNVRKKRRRWAEDCRSSRDNISDDDDDDYNDQITNNSGTQTGSPPGGSSGRQSGSRSRPRSRAESERRREFWTPHLRQSFREQLEKLVILDYIMRNTDRGLDNWMIRIDEQTEEATIVAEPPGHSHSASEAAYRGEAPMAVPRMVQTGGPGVDGQQDAGEVPATEAPPAIAADRRFQVRVGAIDNSLSWPWKHPDAWRSFPFGWLFLPVSLIGQPFSEATRQHFLPLLSSKQWWSETQTALRQCFKQDSDFQEKMYARQIAVMKGQAWNVLETLKTKDHGPLELTRRTRVCVWDDLVDVPVVIPLRPPSEEMQRQRQSAVQTGDLLLPGPGPAEIENTTHAAQNYTVDDDDNGGEDSEVDLSSARAAAAFAPQRNSNLPNPKRFATTTTTTITTTSQNRPQALRSKTRISYEQPRPQWRASEFGRRRNLSFTGHQRPRLSAFASANGPLHDEEEEGDLGYVAAQGMDANNKKVIVERIETVKSRNPVFTWC